MLGKALNMLIVFPIRVKVPFAFEVNCSIVWWKNGDFLCPWLERPLKLSAHNDNILAIIKPLILVASTIQKSDD